MEKGKGGPKKSRASLVYKDKYETLFCNLSEAHATSNSMSATT